MKYNTASANQLADYKAAVKSESPIRRFFQWAARQEADHHIAWAGVSMIAMAAVIFPLSMAVIVSTGASFPLIITVMASLVLVLILNLAAMPTRYTIPAFLLALIINLSVITSCLLLH